ncbi:MAG: DNA alkylation repair protein [Bacteroidaceae bacterium]|nr:DNA alkylation repair protein [Bacteroidaceae bacterium]
MAEETIEKVRTIKRQFHLYMDGVASASMREKGVEYKVNWGLKIQHLKQIASDYDKDYELAAELWKSNTRECKILATMLMPPEKFPQDLAQLWIEQTTTPEIAQYLAFYLMQYTADAASLAFQWIASINDIQQICGYNTLSGLFSQGKQPAVRDMNELIDQALACRSHAAINCLNKLASLSEEHERIVENALRSVIG